MNDKIKVLLEALEFYANSENHKEDFYMDISSEVQLDRGRLAQKALEEWKNNSYAASQEKVRG